MAAFPNAILEMPHPARIDRQIRKGTDFQFRFRLKVSGVVIDPTGWTAKCQVRSAGSMAVLADLPCDIYTDPSDSSVWVRCRMAASATANIPLPSNSKPGDKTVILGDYDVRVIDTSGNTCMPIEGTMRLVNWMAQP